MKSHIVRRGKRNLQKVEPGPLERAARNKWRETWKAKNPELADIAERLQVQLQAGEITEKDFWWLLGEEQLGD